MTLNGHSEFYTSLTDVIGRALDRDEGMGGGDQPVGVSPAACRAVCAQSICLSTAEQEPATFALNAGLWFRRGRLVMVSPRLHHHAAVARNFHLSHLSRFLRPQLSGRECA
jgi:hypothetical protein